MANDVPVPKVKLKMVGLGVTVGEGVDLGLDVAPSLGVACGVK